MGTSNGTILGTTKIVDHGPASARFNVVLLSEGYQASEMAQFETDAQDFADFLFATPPFNALDLQCAINIYRINVTSDDSGADDPGGDCGGAGTTADTYFDGTFCGFGGIRRALTIDGGIATTVLNAQVPEWDQALVIVNSGVWGGTGGQIGVTSKSGGWENIAIHEFGHSAFGLADEYEYWQGCASGETDRNSHPATEPAEVNVTINSNRATIKWGDLIAAATPMPTTTNANCAMCDPQANPVAANTVGAFEGAHYFHCGAFRPVFSCMMRDFGPFCPVCTRRIQQVLAPFSSPTTVTLDTPGITFNDVAEGEETARAAVFTISSCLPLTFQIISGPTVLTGPAGTTFSAPLGTSVTSAPGADPRQANVWITYRGTNDGDTATGTVTIRCVETGQDYVIPITANTVARPTVAVALVLDQSGSMVEASGLAPALPTRNDVLKFAAPVFVNVLQEDNGIGIVAFDSDAFDRMAVQRVGASSVFDPVRNAALSVIATHAPNPAGFTAIGDGLERASLLLQPATGYDFKATVVLTDGHETEAKYIADVAPSINERVFAIGLGTAEQLQPAALAALTNGTGGYLLMTGNLGSDDIFRLSKYYLQILAGVTNTDIVLDPDGHLLPGQVHRIPFNLNEADVTSDVILLSAVPPGLFRFGVETPDGQQINPGVAAGLPAVEFVAGASASYYRMSLPVPIGGGSGAGVGKWHATLTLDEKLYRRYLASKDNQPTVMQSLQTHGVRYSLSVHSYSSLRLRAHLTQNSMVPGATLTLRAVLTEYDLPLQARATVYADMERPDGTKALLALPETEPGVFEISTMASLSGVYHFRVRAAGTTLRSRPFTREQIVTGAVWRGGDDPLPKDDRNPKDEFLCQILRCLLGREVLSVEFEREMLKRGINLAALRKCLDVHCRDKQRPSRPASNVLSQRLSAMLGTEVSTLLQALVGRIQEEDDSKP